VVPCGSAHIAVEYGVSVWGFFIASWGSALVVEMIVGASTIGTSGGLVAGHAQVRWVSELKAVLVDSVLVIGVHAFRFLGSVVNAPGGFLSLDVTWDRTGGFCIASGNYCYEGTL